MTLVNTSKFNDLSESQDVPVTMKARKNSELVGLLVAASTFGHTF